MTTHQSSIPCPKCKSYFRIGTQCNKCKTECPPEPEYVKPEIFIKQKGMLWSGKLHRYLTTKEINAGFKGG